MACIIQALGGMPTACAISEDAFPDISFRVFSQFVEKQFSPDVTLASILAVLFSLIDNTDLLNLHAHQQNPSSPGENHIALSGWIKALARALVDKLGNESDTLFRTSESKTQMTSDMATTTIASKLDDLSKLLDLYPYDKYGQFTGKLNPVSRSAVEPALVICPATMECETETCHG